jgi:hypothetical protein
MINVGGVDYTGIVIGGVECLEVSEGLQEGIHDQGPEASKKYLCLWANRYALANAFLGLVTHTGGQSGSVNYTPPLTYPESANMYARGINIEGRGKPTQGAKQLQYPYAVITVDYGVPTWQGSATPDMSIDPNTPFVYATQRISFGRELLTIPNSALWQANGARLSEMPYSAPHPYAVFNIVLQRVPFLPAPAILTAMRRPLNETTFLGVDPGYLRFDGCENEGQAASDGTFVQSLSYTFTARLLLRWDETYDKTDGSPQQLRFGNAAGTAVLRRSEFRTLIPSNYYA